MTSTPPSTTAEDTSIVTWLAVGTGTALALLFGAWGLQKLAEREDALAAGPDSRLYRPRF